MGQLLRHRNAGSVIGVKHTWLFSQLIDLADLASITVDGVTYPVG